MTTTSVVKYHDSISGAEVELSIAEIKRTICPKATDKEAASFLQLCRYMGLNPFVNDAYLIKYGDGAATMVVGKDAFTKRADAHPQFAGIESGVIIQIGDKEPVNRKGTLVLDGENIVGGWARVARTDRKLDVDTTVSFKEYSTGRAMWAKMPSTMIEKVAIVKALRTAFPATFSGLYDQAEMGIDLNEELEPVNSQVPAVVGAAVNDEEPKGLMEPDSPIIDHETALMEKAKQEPEDEPGEDPTYCKEHDTQFEWRVNPETQEGRYVHQYSYDGVDGATRKGWCVAT